MTLWTPEDVARATGGTVVGDCRPATGVSIDTRTLQPGDLFVALVGETGRDGHDNAGVPDAAFTLAHRAVSGPHVRVPDTLAALHALGGAGRARSKARVAAVTGSVGKTTVKEMLRALLATAGATHAAEASYNNHWGVPLTLARLPPDAVYCIVEIGMNHAGEILPLACLTRPHVAVITNVERVHIAHLGSIEAIADEKATILDGLEPGGAAILPADSPHLPRLLARLRHAHLLFGYGRQSDAIPETVRLGADGSDVVFSLGAGKVHLKLTAPGQHMVLNACAALLACQALGVDPLAAAPALEAFGAVTGRGARSTIRTGDGGAALLLDESYNASPVSVRAALAVLATQPARRRVAVLGDMLELGDDGPADHAALAPAIRAAADAFFSCGSLTKHIAVTLPGTHAENSAALAPVVTGALRDGDAVLVKGSLGSRMRVIVDALTAA